MLKKFLTGLMIATTIGAGAAPAMAAPRHDDRQTQDRVVHRDVRVTHVTRAAPQRVRHWQRGQYMSSADRSRYVVNDYRHYNLPAPRRGYHWVRSDNNSNNFVLVALATGLIASVTAR
jgi:Ni/Co efflux regulator RcnB